VTLEGGLDPDLFVRERGIQAYGAALRDAKRHSDYLIDRARQLFPGQTGDAKVSAMNFLLPHIRRMIHPVKRGQFADDAANKLGIDSALMRQELKQAAAQRVASVPSHRTEPLTVTERVLLRALVLPENDPARVIASTRLAEHPEWIADLATADLLDALAHAPVPDNPLDVAATMEARAHLANALDHSPQPNEPSMVDQVEGALDSLGRRRDERRQRELRSQIAEADRRGDTDMLNKLIAEKILIDRKLRDS
jgi:DNA primase